MKGRGLLVGLLSTLIYHAGGDTCGACEAEYIRALPPNYAERVEAFLCEPNVRPNVVDPRPLVVAASPGTTASRSLAAYMARQCGMAVQHYANVHQASAARTKMAGGILNAEIKLMEDQTKSISALDAYLATYDLVKTMTSKRRSRTGALLPPVDAVMDSPVDRLWYDIYKSFPNAKHVILDRPVEQWWASRSKNHPGDHSQVPVLRAPGSWLLREANAEDVKAAYVALQQLVRCLVPPERLLTINYFSGGANNTVEVEARVAAFLAPEWSCKPSRREGPKRRVRPAVKRAKG